MKERSVGSAAARVIVGLIVTFMVAPAPLRAASFTVNSFADGADAIPGDGICADGGSLCTLRAAVMEANALAGADTISLPAGTYSLTLTGGAEPDAATGDLDVTDDLTLRGAGASVTTVDAAGIDRVLEVSGVEAPRRVVAVVLEGLALTGGITGSGGGGLRAQYADLMLNDCVVRSCHASDGAGGVHLVASALTMEGGAIRDNTTSSLNMCSGGLLLYDTSATLTRVEVAGNATTNYGGGLTLFRSTSQINNSLSLTDCSLTGNSGGGLLIDGGQVTALRTVFSGNSSWMGGGIDNYGTLALRDCAVTGNSASASGIYFGGGGIANHGTLALDNVEVSGNQAPSGTGGGILDVSWGSDATWTNLTCDGNSAGASTGGCLHHDGSSLTLLNATVTDNAAPAGGGVAVVTAGSLRLLNSIMAGNTGGNCAGEIVSLGHNLEDGSECGLTGTGDLTGIDPLLGALADNGGAGRTRALLPGSPALDSAAAEGAPDHDGRGQRRPRDGNLDGVPAPDRGAWEYAQTETSRTGQTTCTPPATTPRCMQVCTDPRRASWPGTTARSSTGSPVWPGPRTPPPPPWTPAPEARRPGSSAWDT